MPQPHSRRVRARLKNLWPVSSSFSRSSSFSVAQARATETSIPPSSERSMRKVENSSSPAVQGWGGSSVRSIGLYMPPLGCREEPAIAQRGTEGSRAASAHGGRGGRIVASRQRRLKATTCSRLDASSADTVGAPRQQHTQTPTPLGLNPPGYHRAPLRGCRQRAQKNAVLPPTQTFLIEVKAATLHD